MTEIMIELKFSYFLQYTEVNLIFNIWKIAHKKFQLKYFSRRSHTEEQLNPGTK